TEKQKGALPDPPAEKQSSRDHGELNRPSSAFSKARRSRTLRFSRCPSLDRVPPLWPGLHLVPEPGSRRSHTQKARCYGASVPPEASRLTVSIRWKSPQRPPSGAYHERTTDALASSASLREPSAERKALGPAVED